MSTDAQRAAVLRHQAKLDRIVIQPSKEEGAKIRQAAADAGQSVQAYVLQAIYQMMAFEAERRSE